MHTLDTIELIQDLFQDDPVDSYDEGWNDAIDTILSAINEKLREEGWIWH